MRYTFSIFFLAVSVICHAQATVHISWDTHQPAAGSDTVYYSPLQKLTWGDFKGKPEERGDATAITSSGFGYTSGASYKDGKVNIYITVFCYFSRKSSWVLKGKETDYALNHEQHHFDITWIVANAFIKQLKAAKFNWNNYNQLLDGIYTTSRQQLHAMQNDYDGETRNGRLPGIQTKWNTKIESLLKGLAIN